MGFRICMLLLFISYTYVSTAQSSKDYPHAKSIFWKITGNGMNKPSYIYGTMHVSRKIAFKVPRQFFDAVNSVDMVALESSPETWQPETDKSPLLSYLTELNNRKESSYIQKNNDFYTGLLGIFGLSKGHIKWLLSRKSNTANHLLYRTNQFNMDFQEDTYLDFYIFQMGKKLGLPILSLESVVGSTILAYKAQLEESAKVDNRKEKFNDIGKFIQDAYENKDIVKLDSAYTSAFSPKYLDYLLYQRNATMVNTFDSVARLGNSVFMAVGCAHLPNVKGILELLVKKGYKVEPIIDDSYFDPSMELLKYDTMFVNTPFQPHFSMDSTLNFQAPGYSSRQVEVGLVEYLCPDMPNGSYYSVTRVPLFHGFISSGDLDQRIDSLIYESTSGKILSKKEITLQDYKGYKVKSKTADGKAQQQEIIITPYELIIAKIIGHEKLVDDPLSDKFFNSIHIRYPNQTKTIAQSDYQITMPYYLMDPVYQTYDNNQPTDQFAGVDASGDNYMFIKSNTNESNKLENDSFQVRFLGEMFARKIDAKILKKTYPTYQGLPSCELEMINKQNQKVYLKTILRGQVYYTLACITNKPAKAHDFFNSFVLTNSKFATSYTFVNDTMHYSFTTFQQPFGKDINYFIFLPGVTHSSFTTSKNKLLHSNAFMDPYSGYTTIIDVNEYNPYQYFRNLDSFWSDYKDELESELNLEDDEFKISVIDSSEKKNISSRTFQIYQSGCSVNTRIKTVITGNREYTIKVINESQSPFLHYMDEAIRSFTVDTTFPITMVKSTLDTMMSQLLSTDSMTKEIFNKNYELYSVDSIDQDRLMTFIDTSSILYKKDEVYNHMITCLKDCKTSRSRAFLKKLYYKNSNNFDAQFQVLYSLAAMKDTASTLLFKSLLTEEAPLSNSNEQSSNADPSTILRPFRSGNKLVKLLYPEILTLMDYDEYKVPILSLTAYAYRKRLIDSNDFSNKKDYFAIKLMEEYRRQTSKKSMIQVIKDDMDDKEADDSYYNSKESFYFKTGKESDQYSNSLLNLSSYYDLIFYHQLSKPFTSDLRVEKILDRVDTSTYSDLLLYFSLDRMEDSIPFSLTPIREHIQYDQIAVPIFRKMLDSYGQDSISKLITSAESYAREMVKYRLEFTHKDSISFVKKYRMTVKNEVQELYMYIYKKENFETPKYAVYGFFKNKNKYTNDFVYIDDINLKELKMTPDQFAERLHLQAETIGRRYVIPGDFSVDLKEDEQDPFYFMLAQ